MPGKALRTVLVRSVVWTGPWVGSRRAFSSKRRRRDGKCDNLSFLRVILLQMGEVLGGTNGYVPLHEGRVLVQSSASSVSQAFSRVRLVFGGLVTGTKLKPGFRRS